MYTFNDFQYETFLIKLYSDAMENPEALMKQFYTIVGEEYNLTSGLVPEKSKLEKFIGTFITCGAIINLMDLFVNGPSISQLLGISSVVLYYAATKTLNENKKGLNKEAIVIGSMTEIYENFVAKLREDIEKTSEKELSDEEIHSMTESLNSGELEFKYKLLTTAGKCPIYLFRSETQENASEVIYKVEDSTLSRIFEILMYKIQNADEGYEELVKEGYLLIKKYINVTTYKDTPKEEIEAVKDEIDEYMKRLISRGR